MFIGTKQLITAAVLFTLIVAPCFAQPKHWTGDGGAGKSIAILAPKADGLPDGLEYLPYLVQGDLVANFAAYSAIKVLDRENLEELYKELDSPVYADEGAEMEDLGNLARTDYVMGGRITKTTTGYNLQLRVTRTAKDDKTTIAQHSGVISVQELENLSGIRRASSELLQKMGIALTGQAKAELTKPAEINAARGLNALALGIFEKLQGNEVKSLQYFEQAAGFNNAEAERRASTLSANISSGGMGANLREHIDSRNEYIREVNELRKQWEQRLKETEAFINDFNSKETMPYTLFYVADGIKSTGKINYQNETTEFQMGTYLHASRVWALATERMLQAVYDGLHATGRAKEWGWDNWPQQPITKLDIADMRTDRFDVVFELRNAQNKVISTARLNAYGSWGLNKQKTWARGSRSRTSTKTANIGASPSINVSTSTEIEYSRSKDGGVTLTYTHVVFRNIKVDDITDHLTVRVASVNGEDAELAALKGGLQIEAIPKGEFQNNANFIYANGEIRGNRYPVRRGEMLAEVNIPPTIWGEKVTSIGAGAFKNLPIWQLTIPNTVTYIGENAFDYTFERGTATIGDGATITIGADVQMAETSLPVDFINAYNKNKKKAGTYVNLTYTWKLLKANQPAEKTVRVTKEEKAERDTQIMKGAEKEVSKKKKRSVWWQVGFTVVALTIIIAVNASKGAYD